MCSHVYNNQELEFSFAYSQTNALPLIYLPYLNTTYKHKTKSGLPFLQLPNGRYYITLAKDIGQLAPHDETNKYYFQIEKKNKGINFIEVNSFSYEYLFALPQQQTTFYLKQTETELIDEIPWRRVAPDREWGRNYPGYDIIPADVLHTTANYLCDENILNTSFFKVKKELNSIFNESTDETLIGINKINITPYNDEKAGSFKEIVNNDEMNYYFFYDENSKLLIGDKYAYQNTGNGNNNVFNVFYSPREGFYGHPCIYQTSGNYFIFGDEHGGQYPESVSSVYPYHYINLNETYTLSSFPMTENTDLIYIFEDENLDNGIHLTILYPEESQVQFGGAVPQYTASLTVGENHTEDNPILENLPLYDVQEFPYNQIYPTSDRTIPTQVFKYHEYYSYETNYTLCLKEALENNLAKIPSLYPGSYSWTSPNSAVGRLEFDIGRIHFPDESINDNPRKYKNIDRFKGMVFQYSLFANFATYIEKGVSNSGNIERQKTMTNYRSVEIPYIQTVTFPEEYDISLSNIKIGQNAVVNNGTYKYILYVEKNLSREYDMSDIPVKS